MHNWVTLLDEPFGTCTWYVEGMAEFYCLVLPWRFGLASREELLEQLNDRAEQYYENQMCIRDRATTREQMDNALDRLRRALKKQGCRS